MNVALLLVPDWLVSVFQTCLSNGMGSLGFTENAPKEKKVE